MLDLVTLCTLRSVMHAVFRAKDTYLLGNCCAVLHNVSTQVVELHPYTSERIVKMLYQLAGRIVVWADAASDGTHKCTDVCFISHSLYLRVFIGDRSPPAGGGLLLLG